MMSTYLWKFADEVVSVCFLCCFYHFLLAHVLISISYVLTDSCIKEYRFLTHDTNV